MPRPSPTPLDHGIVSSNYIQIDIAHIIHEKSDWFTHIKFNIGIKRKTKRNEFNTIINVRDIYEPMTQMTLSL
jgi:hypothetical protein